MICDICETRIQKGESIYWIIADKREEENKPIHSDCMIRWCESVGEHDKAAEIQALDENFYKPNTLPEG